MYIRLKFIRLLILLPVSLMGICFAGSQSVDSLYYVDNAILQPASSGVDASSNSTVSAKLLKSSADRIARKYGANPLIVEAYWRLISDNQYDIGIPAPVIMAIAIHESSFKSLLFRLSGNPFGIKASYPWQGPTYSMMHEGVMTPFRVYASPEEAVRDFGSLMRLRWWYADALHCPADDYTCIVQGLRATLEEPGYASDPQWDEQILSTIKENNLAPFGRH